MKPAVILIGLPGTGKTSSGRRLAKILALRFADSDELVETAVGRRVRDVFAEYGEPAFRDLEAWVIERALGQFDGVLALGGGSITSPATRGQVRASGVPVVHLRANLHTLGARVGDGRLRPLLAEDPAGRLAQLEAERGRFYNELATIAIETDGRTPGQVAGIIAARLHDRQARK